MQIPRYELYKYKEGLPYLRQEGSVESEKRYLTMPEMVSDFVAEAMKIDCLIEEYFWLIPTNTKCKILGIMELSHGTMNFSIASTRDIFRRLLLSGAQSFFIVHNHPSGDTTPSMEDRSITKKIKEAGMLMDIRMIDHIIVGENGKWYSFTEEES